MGCGVRAQTQEDFAALLDEICAETHDVHRFLTHLQTVQLPPDVMHMVRKMRGGGGRCSARLLQADGGAGSVRRRRSPWYATACPWRTGRPSLWTPRRPTGERARSPGRVAHRSDAVRLHIPFFAWSRQLQRASHILKVRHCAPSPLAGSHVHARALQAPEDAFFVNFLPSGARRSFATTTVQSVYNSRQHGSNLMLLYRLCATIHKVGAHLAHPLAVCSPR